MILPSTNALSCRGLSPASSEPQTPELAAPWIPATSAGMTTSAPAAASSQPALAPLVGLHVAEALALGAADAEVELLDVLVLAQRLGVAVHHDAAVLQDVAVSGVAQRHVGVLFGQQEAHLLLGIDVAHDLEDLLDVLRCQPH